MNVTKKKESMRWKKNKSKDIQINNIQASDSSKSNFIFSQGFKTNLFKSTEQFIILKHKIVS